MERRESIETWNKKKIFITLLIVVAIVGFGVKTFVLSKNKDFFSMHTVPTFLKSVMGVNTQKDKEKTASSTKKTTSSLPIQAVIKEKLDDLKKEVNSLNVVDIASSSPQIQKIINDLNSLRQYPVNEAKDICQKICGTL
ncbi:MAG: hypothetical protein AAB600_01215 [Patescibacteria group bacterium]